MSSSRQDKPTTTKAIFYFIRHAESQANVETVKNLIGGVGLTTELTEKGEEQARMLGQYFRQTGTIFSRIYSSTALRTQKTAEHCFNEQGLVNVSVKLDKNLLECNPGSWEGRCRDIYRRPDVAEAMKIDGWNFIPGDGCDVHLCREMPKNFLEYKHSYVLVDRELYYISHQGLLENVVIEDFEQLLASLLPLNLNGKNIIYLSRMQVTDIITKNSGHQPQEDILGESQYMIATRLIQWIYNVLDTIKNTDQPERIAVFSHGNAIRYMIAELQNLNRQTAYMPTIIPCDNVSITQLTSDGESIRVEYRNATPWRR